MLGAERRDDVVDPRRRLEDVRPEPASNGCVASQLEHGTVPQHALEALAAQDEPRLAASSLTARLEPPAAGHSQVAAEDESALETQQQVLPDRLDALQQAAVEPLRDLLRRSPRIRRLDLQPFAHERLQAQRGTMEGIALWHRN
jgi:hypothetical protein